MRRKLLQELSNDPARAQALALALQGRAKELLKLKQDELQKGPSGHPQRANTIRPFTGH